MKKTRRCAARALLAAVFIFAGPARADGFYMGMGFPGLINLGYSSPIQPGLNWRAEYGTGLNIHDDRSSSQGLWGSFAVKADRLSLLADWYPFNGQFRLVGGLNYNDIKGSLNASGRNGVLVNGKPQDLSNQTIEMQIKYQTFTPYMGLGWGSHQKPENPGLGFYSELGLSLGHFNFDVNAPGLKAAAPYGNTTLQTDLEVEFSKVRESTNKLKFLPNMAFGLVYRW